MNFKSDNVASVHPLIMQAIVDANTGMACSYGHDSYSEEMQKVMSQVFEKEVFPFLVCSGTSANSLALSAICPPYAEIYCSNDAHILHDECNAPGLFTHGARLVPSTSTPSKINVESIVASCEWAKNNRPHACKPGCVTITQTTELGQVYSLEEIQKVAKVAHENGMKLHMDGARFTNAMVSLGCTPAEMTWKSGVDVISFGATKNGGMMGEVVLFFDEKLAHDFDYIHKRGGQLMSKTRFFASQMIAFFKDDLWIKLAKHSNQMAKKLENGIKDSEKVKIVHPVVANELFVKAKRTDIQKLWDQGALFYEWNIKEDLYRFVTSWATKESEIEAFTALIRSL